MTFLNSKRLTIYPRIFLALYVIIAGYWMLGGLMPGHAPVDRLEKPIGSDFLQFWTASNLALTSRAWAVYEPNLFYAAQQKVTGVFYPLPWHYPPSFLLIVLPLAFLPYLLSLLLWILATLLLYVVVIRFIAPHPYALMLTLAFPATFQNVIHGQNGFLSAAFLGGGIALIGRHPIAAGVLFGLLTYKPHLAVLLPAALIAGGHWRSLAAMVLTTASVTGATLILFGEELWISFFRNILFAANLLMSEAFPLFKVPSVFASALLAGAPAIVAAILQAIVGFMVLAVVVFVWSRKKTPFYIKASCLSLAVLMATPHIFEYDLTILAIPLAYLGINAWETRYCTVTEEIVLGLAWISPLILSPIAKATSVQLGPCCFIALLVITLGHLKRFSTSASWP
jgi:alpha-1,2-mannosyltransferase